MKTSCQRPILVVLTMAGLSACGDGGGPGQATRTEQTKMAQPATANTVGEPLLTTRAIADEPLFSRQWHLKNSGQILPGGMTGIRGEDLNVEPVWLSCNGNGTCMGEGTTIAVVDDGVEIAHTDLQPNISTLLKHRLYMTNGVGYDGDPTPTAGDSYHGTSIAGIIAARDSNGVGGRGVAPRASVVGYRYFGAVSGGGRISAQKDAMEYQASAIDVSSNSWGANDDGQLHPSNTAWQSGILEGLRIGRGGKGTNYVWAAGNGGHNGDMSNYDGQANFRGVIAVGATTAQGKAAAYSERGANLWVVAPSATNGCEGGIVTVDRTGDNGRNRAAAPNDIADVDYTQCMGGTSSAAPMVSGVVALMLQANPSLSWRDVRAVLAKTARQVDPADQRWSTNAAGHKINDSYGFGAVNAAAAVTEARTWQPLPAERSPASGTQNVNLPIAEGSNAGLIQSISLSNTGIRNIEWVDVTLDADHPNAGDLIIGLVAPSGTISILAEPHKCLQIPSDGTSVEQTDCNPLKSWRFGVAQLLNEPADGNWAIVLIDDVINGGSGVLKSWKIDVYGH